MEDGHQARPRPPTEALRLVLLGQRYGDAVIPSCRECADHPTPTPPSMHSWEFLLEASIPKLVGSDQITVGQHPAPTAVAYAVGCHLRAGTDPLF